MWHVKKLPNNISDGHVCIWFTIIDYNFIDVFDYLLTSNHFQAKEKLETIIDNYIYVQIHMAGKAICIAAQNKISNGDVILTYG